MIKIAVVGSREYSNYEGFRAILAQKIFLLLDEKYEPSEYKDHIEIVSGGARGTDYMAEIFAKEYNIKIHVFLADWDNRGMTAGFIRNIEIARFSDMCIAFWDEDSKGTAHTIKQFKGLGKTCEIVRTNKILTTST